MSKIDDTVALLSRRDALAAMAERTWHELKVGDIRNVTIHRSTKDTFTAISWVAVLSRQRKWHTAM